MTTELTGPRRADRRRRAAPDGRPRRARRAAGRTGRRRRWPWWAEIPAMVVVGLLVALLIKTCLFQVFTIPSGSMENTLRIGDRVGVNKLSPLFGWEPKRVSRWSSRTRGTGCPPRPPVAATPSPTRSATSCPSSAWCRRRTTTTWSSG
ncbi:S26 family signal peptidase [Streptomyces lusitanus]|uniref:S26 family signal peptidase n=1 Tax=Streptomyces lusitanus TaxID=68232 RepID=UPI00363DAFFD